MEDEEEGGKKEDAVIGLFPEIMTGRRMAEGEAEEGETEEEEKAAEE